MMNSPAQYVLFTLALVTVWRPSVVAAGDSPVTGFVNKVYRQGGRESKYVVFIPHGYDGRKPYPTILFLHGLGQSGADGLAQAGRGLATAIRKRERTFPFIVVFPQSQDRTWLADSPDGKRALAILDEVSKNYRADTKRVYLTGYSMGGEGTFSLAAAHPDRFAAIIPICGGISSSLAPRLKDIRCWCFVGDADSPSTVTHIRLLMRAITKAGGRPIYHEYPGVGHDCWDQTYDNPDVYEWLLQQERPPGEGRIMVFRDGALASINPDGKDVRWLLSKDDKVLLHPYSTGSLSPDGKRLALMVIDLKAIEENKGKQGAHKAIAHVHVRDVNDKGPGENLGVSGITCHWSNDSTKVLVSDLDMLELSRKESKATEVDAQAWIVDVKTKKKTAFEVPKNHLVIDWSRDGQWLLALGFDKKAGPKLVMLKKDGSAKYDVTSPGQLPAFGKLSPDGKKVLMIVNQKGKKDEQELVVQSLVQGDKTEPVCLSALNHAISGATWSPDGRRVAYTCTLRRVSDPERNREETVEAFLIVVNADGTNMVTVQAEKGTRAHSIPFGSLEWR